MPRHKTKSTDVPDIHKYNRIMLVGSGGSGKSYFSKRIAQITHYPLFHLDNEFWQPNWQKLPKDEFIARQQNIIATDKWIIDGDYASTMELRLAAADLIIFLDINRLVCILSAAKRTGKKRSDLPEYLEEPKFYNKEFKEFCKYIWNYKKTSRPAILSLKDKYPNKQFLHIKSRKKVKKLIQLWTKAKTDTA